jgi:hypothetical protein
MAFSPSWSSKMQIRKAEHRRWWGGHQRATHLTAVVSQQIKSFNPVCRFHRLKAVLLQHGRDVEPDAGFVVNF